ncbi:MAG: ribonuclease H-like domain-containing protein [bacterium]|nr:ribonuclease H-like domain-containing protein [bacterium]
MDLRSRLAKLDRAAGRPAPGSAPAGTGDRQARAVVGELPAELGLREEATPDGPCWYREWRECADGPDEVLPDLGGILTHRQPRAAARGDVLLLDTETTGLAGGTGTLAFLVGVGWWEGSELVVRQLFLPGPGREAGLLAALAQWSARFSAVVTYNGASFDLPLLRTRALMNRRADPLGHLDSWDLLPAARRLWGRVLPDCRQQTVEASICGLARAEGDIEGFRIPEVWRDWLGGSGTDDLLCVLRHNQRDVRGMAAILGRACAARQALDRPAAPGPGDPLRAWTLARVAQRRRDHAAAADWITVALSTGSGPAGVDGQLLARDAVPMLKRVGRWSELERLLGARIAAGAGAWAHREAAILYERRLHRLDKALFHAGQADESARVARLKRRLERAAGTRKAEGP